MTPFVHTAGRGIAKAVLLSLILNPTATSRLSSQATNTVSATMLRVLAEAADGNRTGRPVFFLADYRFPHQVVGPFASRDEALRARPDSIATFGVFGPYVTPAEPAADTAPQVTEVRITMKTASGQRRFKLDLDKVDALFFSSSAVDKFVIPYYTRIYGADYARKLQTPLSPSAIIRCHIKDSVYCIPNPDGSLSRVALPKGAGLGVDSGVKNSTPR